MLTKSLLFAVLFFCSSVLNAQEESVDETKPPPKARVKSSASASQRENNTEQKSTFAKDLYFARQSFVFDVRRDRIMHSPVETLDPTTGKFEMDLLFLHFGLSVAIDQEIQLDGRRIETYMPSLDGGIRVHLPFRYVQPFVGAGYTLGWLAASDPNDRGSHDITVLWQGSRSGVWGFYGELGVDVLVPIARRAGLGLRAYLRYGSLNSESIPDLGGAQIASTKLTPFVGIVFAR